MCKHVRLRVGAAASVDRAVALARLERRRLPLRLVSGRHDVVVPVQQNGRCAVGSRDLARDDGSGIGKLESGEVLGARGAAETDDVVVRLEQPGRVDSG